jgi:hypothetical protein
MAVGGLTCLIFFGFLSDPLARAKWGFKKAIAWLLA